jgi:hypothetical protein
MERQVTAGMNPAYQPRKLNLERVQRFVDEAEHAPD